MNEFVLLSRMAKGWLTKSYFQDKNVETTHVMPILPPPTYEQVQSDRLQEVENSYKQNQDLNSRNDFTIIEFGEHRQGSSAPMNQMMDLELNEQRLRGKSVHNPTFFKHYFSQTIRKRARESRWCHCCFNCLFSCFQILCSHWNKFF